MKKLIAAVALCVGSVTFAQQASQPSQEAATSPSQTSQKNRPGTGVDATEVGPAIGSTTKDVLGIDKDKKIPSASPEATGGSGTDTSAAVFKKDQAMDLRGTLKSAENDDVSIARKGLPDAKLDVRDSTVVMLDGKVAKAEQLPAGADIRAKFQIDGDDIVAVELRATSPKGTSGVNK